MIRSCIGTDLTLFAAPVSTVTEGLRTHVDASLCNNGIRRLSSMEHGHEFIRCSESAADKGQSRTPFDKKRADLPQQGATLYTAQLALNLIWMPLYFGLKRPIEATVDIVALTGLTGYLIYIWGQVDEVAGWALVPYLGWLTFATYLSAGAGYLNNWSFEGKERPLSEKPKGTNYVDEKGGKDA